MVAHNNRKILAGVVPLRHHQGKRKSQARKIKRNRSSSSRKLPNNLLLMEWLMLVVKNRK
jgi:hypothetical protein